ncbi:4a-hydroxytetrahydrobiopterin dehydratase [Roseateles saccharophilus]|uniref:Putative pterin-4-alpha-carbinolamine dehydratase n=1 Tax=Roseateles saccharophilus TaxID=304 RepID=A0A4R3VHB2_ROSSA|nr:4a-hydroxytetrahydrobiopterin dehydratase [Roseateles saccharophilus]MDG0833912.1 4a-hydroxytetrahydrobiopterin dehydratase [Roseateles saccharophilus]TCV02265.1 4a-hydroxytetrahydrobiopterin dehydratase [Roseateles saccharophilus]
MNLLLAQCDPKAPLLDADTRERVLAALPGWLPDAEAKVIGRRFGFDNFYQVMAFVDAVAEIAHAQDHHPEMLVGYNACTVSWTTHSRGGLTLNDAICAAQVSALPEASGT